jgi:hypothetical protein
MADLSKEWESAKPLSLEDEWNNAKPVEPSTGSFVKGLKKGMSDVATGVAQRGLEIGKAAGIVSPETVGKYQQFIDEQRREAPTGGFQKAGEIVGQGLPALMIPGGAATKLSTRLLTGSLAGAGMGYIQPTATGESTAVNTAIGGALGLAGVGVAAGIGKTVNAIRKPITNYWQTSLDRMGIRATLGDITQNPIVKKMETWLEQVPVIGLSKFRKGQNVEAQKAAENYLAEFTVSGSGTTKEMAGNREFVNSLYQNLEGTVNGISAQEIAPATTKKAASEILDRYPDLFKKVQDTKTEGILRNIKSGVSQLNVGPSTLLGTEAKVTGSTITIPKTLTFQDAWTLREGLGDLIGRARQRLGHDVDKTELAQFERMYSAINKDIDSWTASIGRPDVRTAIDTANDGYKQYVVKYRAVADAYAKATHKGSEVAPFSPQRFSNALRDIVDQYRKKEGKMAFTDADISKMTGVSNIMEVVNRSGYFMENPPTGNRWGLPLMGAEVGSYLLKGTAGGVGMAGGILGATGFARFLTGTESGKRFALAASKVETNSNAAQKIVDAAYREFSTMFGVAANVLKQTQPQTTPQNTPGNPDVID